MLTINGVTGFDGRITFPRTGAWHADLRIDGAEAETSDIGVFRGDVSIDVDDGRLILQGSAIPGRAGIWQDTGRLRIVGGYGGLSRIATPKHYTSASVRTVLADLLANAGEKLSPKADAATLGRFLEAWTTVALPVGRLISRLLLSADPNATWRVLPDGTVWVGLETWPDSGLDEDEFQVLAESPESAQATLGIEVPLLMPGTKLGDRKVSYVEHRIGAQTRTECWFDDGTPQDRMRNAIAGLVKGAQAPIDYLALYVADVVAQTGSTVDVRPVDKRIPSMASVPLFAGLPHWKVQLAPGGRVLIGWSGGDPKARFAVGFDQDVFPFNLSVAAKDMETLKDGIVTVTPGTIDIDASLITIGTRDDAEKSPKFETYRDQEASLSSALASTASAAAAACTGPLSPLAATFEAMAAAWNSFEAAAPTYLSTKVKNS